MSCSWSKTLSTAEPPDYLLMYSDITGRVISVEGTGSRGQWKDKMAQVCAQVSRRVKWLPLPCAFSQLSQIVLDIPLLCPVVFELLLISCGETHPLRKLLHACDTTRKLTSMKRPPTPHILHTNCTLYSNFRPQKLLTLKVLVATIDAQWEGMGDVGSARYEPALLPPCPTIRVLSYSN